MKKLFTLTILFGVYSTVFTQVDTTWKKGGGAILNFNQTSLTKWEVGGESNHSATLLTNFYANYKL
ncbi:MAG: hypothetical protein KBG70_14220 [Chitinophagales bacterium]|nr:hypothetical protein [Chitinophagales bacterium]